MTTPLEPALERAVPIAARCPSSHNSQPWALGWIRSEPAARALGEALGRSDVEPGRWIVSALDRDRELRSLPYHATEMLVSCGIHLDSLLWELGKDGWRGEGRWFASGVEARPWLPGWPSTWAPLAAVEITPAEPRDDPRRRGEGRTTNRAPFREDPVPGEVLERLARVGARIDPDRRLETRVEFVHEADRLAAAADFIALHAERDFSDRAAWAETYRYLRFGRREIAAAEDGMPITQVLGPMGPAKQALHRWLLAPFPMRLAGLLGHPRRLSREFGGIFGRGPALAAISAGRDLETPFDHLAAGGAVLDFWERASAEGLVVHPLSVILQHPDLRVRLSEVLGLRTGIFFFARLGRPLAEFPPAPKARDAWKAVVRL